MLRFAVRLACDMSFNMMLSLVKCHDDQLFVKNVMTFSIFCGPHTMDKSSQLECMLRNWHARKHASTINAMKINLKTSIFPFPVQKKPAAFHTIFNIFDIFVFCAMNLHKFGPSICWSFWKGDKQKPVLSRSDLH